ncbi:MAG: hypothetical protein ACHQUC_08050 [Chlamydiales bacterium]
MVADFLVRQAAASAGSHAELYTINNAQNHEITRVRESATQMFGENYVVEVAAIAIGTCIGANVACSPVVRRSARLIGQGVEQGVNLAGSAIVGSPSLALNTAKVAKVVGGLLMAGGASAAAAALPSALDYLPAAASVAVYNYLNSKPVTPSEQSNTEETAIEEASPKTEEDHPIDEAKLADLRDLLSQLNPEEVVELQKMVESLKREMDPKSTLGDKFDSILDVMQEAVVSTGINFVAGSLGNVVRLKVINGAYDATVTIAGKAAKKSLSALGDGYIARKIQAGAEKTARAFAHGFVASRVATSDTVIALSDKAGDLTTKVTAKGLNYVNDTLSKSPKKKRSFLKTAARVTGLTVAGVAIACVAPGALALNTAKVGTVALGKSAMKAYRRYKGDTPEQKATRALAKSQAALSAYSQGTGSGVDEAKVTAAFIRLTALSEKEQELLSKQSLLLDDEWIVIESVVIDEKALKRDSFSLKTIASCASELSVEEAMVEQISQTASAA